jgi:hypothetical protein
MLSDFRDEVMYDLVSAAEHPKRAYDMLRVLERALIEKFVEACDERYITETGLNEAANFVVNLRNDVAREYGYTKEGN